MLPSALRSHVRQPVFALTVVGTLALTTGATTAVFALVSTVLVRALPFSSPDRLVWIGSVTANNPDAPFSLPEFMDYRAQIRTLSAIAAYANWSASLKGDGVPERYQGARMSGNFFDVLGVTPALGRLLTDADDRLDAPFVAVLSHRLWQRRFGGADDVVGRAVRINGEAYVVVGVLPPHFPLPLRGIDVVTPLAPDRDPLRHVRNSVNFLRVVGRLRPGVGSAQAEAELTGTSRRLRQQFPTEYARKDGVRVASLHEVLVGGYRQSMLLLFGAVVVVLATALANLMSLALVRANGRRAELLMRTALGASGVQLTRHLAAEALILAASGTVLGCVAASRGIRLARLWAPLSIPRLGEITLLDGTIAVFVVVVTLIVTALLTLAPVGVVARLSAAETLRLASRGVIGDRWNLRLRNGMVAGEIAAALVLLLATVVLLQNLRWLHRLDPGFEPDGTFQARVTLPPTYGSPDDVSRFCDRLEERLAASPGVGRIGMISAAPLSGVLATVPFSVAGQSADERDRVSANFRVVSPGYFASVGTTLLQGRLFTRQDRADRPAVAVVSAALAGRFLGGAVGQRFSPARLFIDDNNIGPRPVEVVGIVENVRHTALDLPPALDIYVPVRQIHKDGVPLIRNNQFWMVRTDSALAAFRATFLAHLRAVDADAAVSDIGTMREFLNESLGPRRFNLALFGAFSLTAVLLAVVGLYGLVSYAVSQRVSEIGLRMAIGATERDIQWMVLRQAAVLAIVGAAAGLALAAVVRPFVSGMARSADLSAKDLLLNPSAVLVTAALLVGVVLVAAWLPARRAARIEPTLALRGH
jgi:predicted permease